MNFNGKTAFITGAAKGIGKAIAVGMAKNGADLILTDILKEELSATAKEISKYGVKVKDVYMDVTNEDAVRLVI